MACGKARYLRNEVDVWPLLLEIKAKLFAQILFFVCRRMASRFNRLKQDRADQCRPKKGIEKQQGI